MKIHILCFVLFGWSCGSNHTNSTVAAPTSAQGPSSDAAGKISAQETPPAFSVEDQADAFAAIEDTIKSMQSGSTLLNIDPLMLARLSFQEFEFPEGTTVGRIQKYFYSDGVHTRNVMLTICRGNNTILNYTFNGQKSVNLYAGCDDMFEAVLRDLELGDDLNAVLDGEQLAYLKSRVEYHHEQPLPESFPDGYYTFSAHRINKEDPNQTDFYYEITICPNFKVSIIYNISSDPQTYSRDNSICTQQIL